MPQFFQDNIPLLQRDTGTQISIPATYNGQPARARISGQGYRWTSPLACNLATTGLGGLDTGALAANTLYHVYLCVSSNVVGLVTSANGPSVGPTGFSQNRYIGRLRTQSGSANAAELAVVNVIVGAGDEISAQNANDWISYTPTVSSGTWTVTRGFYRRVGSTMELNIYAGPLTVEGSGVYSWTLPNNLTTDLTSLGASGITPALVDTDSGSNTFVQVGIAMFGAQGAVFYADGATGSLVNPRAVLASTTSIAIVTGSPSNPGRANVLGSGNNLVASTVTSIQIQARIPIAEWQGLFS